MDVNTLTVNEKAAALVLLQECLNGMGGKVPADLEDDEFTWVAAETLVSHGWTAAEAAGTFSSLADKGVIFEYEPKQWVLSAWREVATLWADWVEAGKVASALRAQLPAGEVEAPAEVDEAASFTAALIKAGADEGMGIPYPGIICSTLRAFAVTWTGSRATFIKTAQLAGFNRFTAQTQWQRGRKEGLSVIDALGEGGFAVDVQEEAGE